MYQKKSMCFAVPSRKDQQVMWYSNRPQRRHMRRGLGIPFAFPFIMLFFFHSFAAFFAAIVLSIMITLIFSAFNAASRGNGGPSPMSMNDPWGQRQSQTPYYQPSTPLYQTPYQQAYRPYEQGYTPAPSTYQPGGQTASSSVPAYEEYEQPHAQYPEQMPPMQQP